MAQQAVRRAPFEAAVEGITPLGWSVVALGVVSMVLARVLHWQEFLVIAAVCATAFVVSFAFAFGAVSLSVAIDAGAARAVVGERLVGALHIQNRRSTSAYGVRIEMPVGDAIATFTLRRLRGHETVEELFVIPTARRGVVDIGPVSSVKGDPLGLLRRPRRWSGIERIYVHPATASLQPLRDGRSPDLDGQPTAHRSDSDIAFHSLRDYVAGDDLRHVHWRSSARHGSLLVRQFNQTRRAHVLVIVSNSAADYRHPSEFELAVSIAATIAKRVQLDSQTLTVVVGGRELPATSPVALLDRWSEVDLDDQADDAIARARNVCPQATSVVYLAGGRADAADRAARLRRGSFNAEQFVLIADPTSLATFRDTRTGALATFPTLHAASVNLPRVLG